MVDVMPTGLGHAPTPLAGDLGGRTPAQFRVRLDAIVVVLPGGKNRSGVGQRREQRLVEAFVAQPAVERFHKAVLRRLARRDVAQFDVPLLRPAQGRGRGQLGPVVAYHRQRLAAAAFVRARSG